MQVYIRANHPMGLPHVARARRAWPAGESVPVEVLDQDDDPPDIEIKDSTTGQMRKIADPRRIGRKSFEALQKDHRISVLSDPTTQQSLNHAAVEHATSEAKRHAARATELEIDLGAARATIEDLKKRVGDLEAELRSRPTAEAKPAPEAKAGEGDGEMESGAQEGADKSTGRRARR